MIQRGWGKMIQSEIIYFDSVLKHFQDIFYRDCLFLSQKINDTAMSEKYHFIFQNVKNGRSTVSFCHVAKHKT